jgi:predicted Zn-dependent protease
MIERMSCHVQHGLCRITAVLTALSIALAGVSPVSAQSRSRGVDNLPALGEASVDELSPAAEQRLGDQIFQEFMRLGVVFDDPEATDILALRAGRLLQAAQSLGHSEVGRPFRFFMVRDPSINAFALPGGYIGIHTGLITASERESEVMSVLSHEIGHVTQRHIARMFGQQRQSSGVMMAAMLLAVLAAGARSADAAMGAITFGQTLALREQMAFSRDAEREADRVGLQILTESGFDPLAMASMFERLSQAGRLYDNNAPAYLRSHPLTTERIADVQSRLQNDPDLVHAQRQQPGAGNSLAYDWLRARLLAQADMRVDGLRTARQRLETSLRDGKSALPASALHYGMAWAALGQRDIAAARNHAGEADRLAQAAGAPAEVGPMLIHLQLRTAMADPSMAERPQTLAALADAASARAPQSRAVMRAAVEARLSVEAPADATAQLARAITQAWPWDPQSWSLLGRTEAARGMRTAQHAAVAEQYALAGAYPAAIEQLMLARTAGDADFITMSKIDARLAVLRGHLRREQIERERSGGR